MSIPAAQFKAECLRLMDEVARTGRPLVITKHGKPVAQLVPVPVAPNSRFGYMKNTVRIDGDVVGPIEETWDAESNDYSAVADTARRKPGRRPGKNSR